VFIKKLYPLLKPFQIPSFLGLGFGKMLFETRRLKSFFDCLQVEDNIVTQGTPYNWIPSTLSQIKYNRCLVTFLMTTLLMISFLGQNLPIFAAEGSTKPFHQTALWLVQETMAAHFLSPPMRQKKLQKLETKAHALAQTKTASSPRGVFVTLSLHGKPRACWGSLSGVNLNPSLAIIESTLGALTKEYRYPPIHASEISKLKKQVTVIKTVVPVQSYRQINPYRDGVMVQQGGKSGIILPGEATDAYHQVVMAKLKAGIQPKDSFQLYRMQADVYR
jgi:AMMECR1 domain-containing protein